MSTATVPRTTETPTHTATVTAHRDRHRSLNYVESPLGVVSQTVAACQLATEDLDVARNLAAIQERVAALPDRVSLAVCPEYALTGFVGDERLADAARSRTSEEIESLRELATTENVALAVGFVEDAGSDLYNATAYVDRDGDLTVYRKRHLWANEAELLSAGEELATVETPVGRAGLLTCYDLNFVEESAALAVPEIDALVVVGAWPAAYSENWRLLVRARALDGVRWVIAAGRTGRRRVTDAEATTYAGRSMVARPDGGVHRALDRGERTLVADLDPEILADQRELVGVFEE